MSQAPYPTRAARRARLAATRLQVLVSEAVPGRALVPVVRAALAGGADVIQLREKEASDDRILALASELLPLCHRHGALLVINDRPDLARDAGADGVHLGQEDGSVADARDVLGSAALVGVSTHDVDELTAALGAGADYVGVGAMFPTESKGRAVPVGSPDGLAPLGMRAEAAAVPAYAIGGITTENITDVAAAGFARVAVCAAVTGAYDPARAARDLIDALIPRV